MLQLKILTDTLFKLRPIQSALLPDEEEQPIQAGAIFNIQAYLPINDHIRITLSDQSFLERNTWYVSVFHAHVLDDGVPVPLFGLQLLTLQDTILKLRTLQSTQLAEDEKYPIGENTMLRVQSYALVGDHIKVAFADQFFRGRNTWFVYVLHANLYRDGTAIPLWGIQLRILQDTPLKLRPVQSTELPDEAKVWVKAGSLYYVQSYAITQNHIRVAFFTQSFRGLNTWYVYKEHVQLLQDSKPIQVGGRTLSTTDYQQAAAALGVDVATIRAVIYIETSGGGFQVDGRPKILFEAHWFSYLTQNRYNTSHPHLSSATWNPNLYVGGAGEYDRLNQAIALNRSAALQSASWGLGQILGVNFRAAGYSDVEAFVADMYESEGKQLMAMVNFIKSNGLDRPLRAQDWAGFARGYNGPSYAANNYDRRLADAYAFYLRQP